MSPRRIGLIVLLICGVARMVEAEVLFSGERKLNNLVSELLEVSSISGSNKSFTFRRSSDGWIFISSSCKGRGTAKVILENESVITQDSEGGREAVRYVTKGDHTIHVECRGKIIVEKLAVRAIPELIH